MVQRPVAERKPHAGLLHGCVADAELVWSKNSCGISVIKVQEAAEALASLYIP